MPDDHLDFTLLPSELQHLGPLIARYAESDDVGRAAILANAPDEELRALSDGPAQHWDAINAFWTRTFPAILGRFKTLRWPWTASRKRRWRPSSNSTDAEATGWGLPPHTGRGSSSEAIV